MKTLRSHRAPSKRSGLHRWLIETMLGSTGQTEPRRLLCEQLERRYALHGMGWFDGSVDRFEFSETIIVDAPSTNSRFSELRTWEGEHSSFGRSQPRTSNSFAIDDGSIFEGAADTFVEPPCKHPRGLTAEGEGPGALPGPGAGDRGLNGFVKMPGKPEAKIVDSVQPATDIAKSDPPAPKNILGENSINLGISFNANTAKDAPTQYHPSTTTSTTQTPASTGTGFLLRVTSFFGSSQGGGLGTSASDSMVPRSTQSGPSAASSQSRSDAAPTLANAKSEGLAFASLANATGRSGVSLSNSIAANTVNGDQETATSFDNHWQSHATSKTVDGASKLDSETEGLLSELRTVIDKLANDRATEKADLNSSRRRSHALDGRASDEWANSDDRRQNLFDDGMLELAATSDRIATSTPSVTSLNQTAGEHQLRSQLIASLELSREFELAGQSVHALKSVIDPTTIVRDANLAAEEIDNWQVQVSSTVALSSNSVDAESSIWQRSILPLSFLAISGLLIRSRKKYRALQARK